MHGFRIALALAVACTGDAHADDEAAIQAEFDRHAAAVVDAARDAQSPRVLIAAASFAADNPFRPVDPALAARRDALAARAMHLGADDPMVWYVLALDCPLSAAACARADAVRRLRAVAPNNALGWVMDAGPGDDADLRFARAVQANRFDTYEGEFMRALYEAARLAPPPPGLLADVRASSTASPEQMAPMVLALGRWLAKALPPLAEPSQRCRTGVALEGQARADCIALGRLLSNRSRNVLAQRLGARLLVERLPDGQERRDAEAALRRLHWLAEKQMELAAVEEYPASLLYWLHATADELAVTRAMLRENGIPEEPPPNWQSRSQSVLPALSPSAD